MRVYGELVAGHPAPYDTIWTVASLCKPVVTMLTLERVAAGKWREEPDHPAARGETGRGPVRERRQRIQLYGRVIVETFGKTGKEIMARAN